MIPYFVGIPGKRKVRGDFSFLLPEIISFWLALTLNDSFDYSNFALMAKLKRSMHHDTKTSTTVHTLTHTWWHENQRSALKRWRVLKKQKNLPDHQLRIVVCDFCFASSDRVTRCFLFLWFLLQNKHKDREKYVT